MQIEKLFNESILQKLFENRHEDFSQKFTDFIETKKKYENVENRLESLLQYISADHYNYVKTEINEILTDMQICIEYCNSGFYKIGIVDGMNLKKEIKKMLEENFYGKINE